jgi:uncharacterized protein YqjF (DUF2071 family)
MRQSWYDLAFIHYRIDQKVLRPLIPAWLDIDVYDTTAWLAIVPFRMHDVMVGNMRSIGALSNFPEFNVRTYVTHKGKPGVWFFSLDAHSMPIVAGGKLLVGLPYRYARMRHETISGTHVFASTRIGKEPELFGEYRPTGEEWFAKSGTFEHWATERYCLYSTSPRGRKLRLDVHHKPWPLYDATGSVTVRHTFLRSELVIDQSQPHFLFSPGVDVVSFWSDTL